MINNNHNKNIHQSSIQWKMGSVVVTKHRDKRRRYIGTNHHEEVPSGKGASAEQEYHFTYAI